MVGMDNSWEVNGVVQEREPWNGLERERRRGETEWSEIYLGGGSNRTLWIGSEEERSQG